MTDAYHYEMEGYFLGTMPPHKFLNQFLPLDASVSFKDIPNIWKLRSRGHFKEVASSKTEVEMSKTFIEALKPFLQDMVFLDTYSDADAEPGTAPRIVGYNEDDLPEQGSISFPKMSTFVNLKHSEDVDPFYDPKVDPRFWDSHYHFEKWDQAPKSNLCDMAAYAADLCGNQFRVHLFSVSVCGQIARFIRWDRGGAIVTRRFNYVTQPDILAGFFYRYSRLHRRGQGYDPTLSIPSEEEVESASLFKDRLKDANPAHLGFRKLMVPSRDDPEQEMPFLISYPPAFTMYSTGPFSRTTRGMLAFDLTTGELNFLKDYWRDVVGREKEGDIYTILEHCEPKVPNIPPFGMGNDVRDHRTITQMFMNMDWGPPHPSWEGAGALIELRHYRMTLKVVARPLTNFDSSRQFVGAIADAMEAHDGAYFDAGILHCDISLGNILITDEGKGLLIDWDICFNTKQCIRLGPIRMGTWRFMSVSLLQDPYGRNKLEDDREAAFYVLLWIALAYTKRERVPNPKHYYDGTESEINNYHWSITCDNLRAFDEEFYNLEYISGGIRKQEFLTTDTLFETLQFSERPQLNQLLQELTGVLGVRYKLKPMPDEFAFFEKQNIGPENKLGGEGLFGHLPAAVYTDGYTKLRERGWLVNTIRKYLAIGDWPEDGAELQGPPEPSSASD